MPVCFVIPTYNRAHTIGEAVRSALDADAGVEVIVVDDGSVDHTREVLAQFGSAITVIRQVNAGVSQARNAGIQATTRPWIKFVDSDDIVPSNAVRLMKQHAATVGTGMIVLGDAECLHDDGTIVPGAAHGYGYCTLGRVGPLTLTELLTGAMQTELPLFPRDALLSVGGFDEGLYLGEDKEIGLRLWHGGWRFSRMPVIAARIRIHGHGRLSTSKGATALDNLILYFRKMRALLDDMPDVPPAARIALARNMWSEARDAARSGHVEQAEALFEAARDLGGASAVTGGLAMRTLYQVVSPVKAERLGSLAKGVLGGRSR